MKDTVYAAKSGTNGSGHCASAGLGVREAGLS